MEKRKCIFLYFLLCYFKKSLTVRFFWWFSLRLEFFFNTKNGGKFTFIKLAGILIKIGGNFFFRKGWDIRLFEMRLLIVEIHQFIGHCLIPIDRVLHTNIQHRIIDIFPRIEWLRTGSNPADTNRITYLSVVVVVVAGACLRGGGFSLQSWRQHWLWSPFQTSR